METENISIKMHGPFKHGPFKHGPHCSYVVTCWTGLPVILSTSHLRTLCIENHGPVKLYTYMYMYDAHGEMYIGINSRLIDMSLCCIRVLVAKPDSLSPERAAVRCDSTCGLRIT